MLAQTTVVSRPICPTLVHDDATRMAICVVGIALCLHVFYRALRNFDAN